MHPITWSFPDGTKWRQSPTSNRLVALREGAVANPLLYTTRSKDDRGRLTIDKAEIPGGSYGTRYLKTEPVYETVHPR